MGVGNDWHEDACDNRHCRSSGPHCGAREQPGTDMPEERPGCGEMELIVKAARSEQQDDEDPHSDAETEDEQTQVNVPV